MNILEFPKTKEERDRRYYLKHLRIEQKKDLDFKISKLLIYQKLKELDKLITTPDKPKKEND
jgi:hypothetical protein